MRGALPDAECARCGELYPPAFEGAFVTCKKCGLVFTPHEVQHRVRHALAAPGGGPPVALPKIEHLGAGVTAEETPERFELRVRADRRPTFAVVLAGIVVAQAWPLIGLAIIAASGLLLARRSRMRLANGALVMRRQPFFLPAWELPASAVASARVAAATLPALTPDFDVILDLTSGRSLTLVRGVPRRTATAIVERLTQQLANRRAVG